MWGSEDGKKAREMLLLFSLFLRLSWKTKTGTKSMRIQQWAPRFCSSVSLSKDHHSPPGSCFPEKKVTSSPLFNGSLTPLVIFLPDTNVPFEELSSKYGCPFSRNTLKCLELMRFSVNLVSSERSDERKKIEKEKKKKKKKKNNDLSLCQTRSHRQPGLRS